MSIVNFGFGLETATNILFSATSKNRVADVELAVIDLDRDSVTFAWTSEEIQRKRFEVYWIIKIRLKSVREFKHPSTCVNYVWKSSADIGFSPRIRNK